MILGLILASAAVPAPDCTPASIQMQVNVAAGALPTDSAKAKATIEPVLSCPPNNSPAYYAHVLRAEIAAREQEWAAVRPALATVGFHPELRISVRAAALLLRADEALKSDRVFAGDRAGILAANDAMLSKAGRKIETFRAGKASVTSYEAEIPQAALHRVLEFIITPDDERAFPQSILLTDDVDAAAVQSELMKQMAGGHAWFVDAYDCAEHRTLDMPAGPSRPDYASVKAIVVKALEKGVKAITSSSRRGDGLCDNLGWILPGLGARLSTPRP